MVANETGGGILIGPSAEPTTMVSDSIYGNASFGVAISAPGAPAQPVLTAYQEPDGSGTRVDVYATDDEPAWTLFQIYSTTECSPGEVQPRTLLATLALNGPLAHGDTATVLIDTQATGTQLTATTTVGGLEPKTSKSVECRAVPAVNSLGRPPPRSADRPGSPETDPQRRGADRSYRPGSWAEAGAPSKPPARKSSADHCVLLPLRLAPLHGGHDGQSHRLALQPGAKAKLVLRLTSAGEKLLRSRGRLKLDITVTIEQTGTVRGDADGSGHPPIPSVEPPTSLRT